MGGGFNEGFNDAICQIPPPHLIHEGTITLGLELAKITCHKALIYSFIHSYLGLARRPHGCRRIELVSSNRCYLCFLIYLGC